MSVGTPSRIFIVLMASCAACTSWESEGEPVEMNGTGDGGAAGAPATSCPEAFDPSMVEPAQAARGFRVGGNKIEDAAGREVLLRGVNRSGSEYQCAKSAGHFDGTVSEQSVRAMVRWNINAVRIPLNEACWLAIGNISSRFSGENYKSAIVSYVNLLQRYGLTPILDLHWAAPGDHVPQELWAMPNADHSEDFWRDVAETFLDNDGVIFEPYNEPFPDRNMDTDAAWDCWRNGCEAPIDWQGTETYQAVGMQALVDAIRSTGSEHLILLGGVQFANSLSQWLEHKPDDPIDNLGAAWHVYNYSWDCTHEACWDDEPGLVAEQYPVVITELGQNDCQGDFVTRVLDFAEERQLGHLAWSWNAYGPCTPDREDNPGNPYAMITGYSCAIPNGEPAETFYARMLAD